MKPVSIHKEYESFRFVIRRLSVEVWVRNFEVNSQPNKEQPCFNTGVSGTVVVPFDFLLLISVFTYFDVTNDHVAVDDFHDWLVDWRQSRWLGPPLDRPKFYRLKMEKNNFN